MHRKVWLLLVILLCVAPASAQTPGNRPSTQVAPSLPDGLQPALTNTLRPENLITFDYRQAELRWIDQRWQLVAGTVSLKDFGRREADARAALRTIQTLQLTQRGTVGTPVPVMEYWLADGAAPHRFGGGGRVETLDLTSLRVEQVEGQWCVRDNRHRLFAFGSHKDDAQQALALIRHYGFTHVGAIGPATPTMIYFMGSESTRTHALAPSGGNQPLETSPAQGANATRSAGTLSTQGADATRSDGTLSAQHTDGLPLPERLAFDYRQVQVRRDQNDWKLVFGGHVFANFGADQQAAQQALSLFQYYRFTEQLMIGRPVPTFSYFLVAGKAPRGLKFGLPAEAFFPESVMVRQVGNQWIVCDGERPLVNFGDQQEDARQLARAMQRYRFDHLCRLGSGPGRSLTILLREH